MAEQRSKKASLRAGSVRRVAARSGWLVGALVSLAVGSPVPAWAKAENKVHSALSPSSAAWCEGISGVGDPQGIGDFQDAGPREELWIPAFTAKPGPWEELCQSDPSIAYFTAGSGEGMSLWGNNLSGVLEEAELYNEGGVKEKVFPTFVSTDAAPGGFEAGKATRELALMDDAAGQGLKEKEGVVTVPVAQSAIAVMVSLPVGCAADEFKFPQTKASDLYQEWSHKTTAPVEWSTLIKKGGVGACGTPSTLYADSNAYGTNAGFKRFFAALKAGESDKALKEWKAVTATPVQALSASEWPAETGQVETGIAGALKGKPLNSPFRTAKATYETPGSIGYADAANAYAAGFTTTPRLHEANGEKFYSFLVWISNNAFGSGVPEFASPFRGSESNCSGAEYVPAPRVAGNVDWSSVLQVSQESGGSANYPICTLVYDLAWHEYSHYFDKKYTEGQVNALYAYLKYVTSEKEGQAELSSKHYGKLPAEEIAYDLKGLIAPGLSGAPINF